MAPGESVLTHFLTSDGARIAYSDEGRGRPVVLLHGLMANRLFFDGQRPLAGDFRLIAVDLRGHGDSDALPPVTVARVAADVAELAAALDLRAAIGVGWSLGASVLWRSLEGPAAERFAGAVVVDMTPRVLNGEDWDLGLSADACAARSLAIRNDFASFSQAAGRAIFASDAGVSDSLLERGDWAASQFARADGDAVAELWDSLVEQDFRSALARLRQPTLIVHGAQSHLYGSDTADFLVQALPNARCIRFEASGHSPQFEQPELFNDAIRDFAARLSPAPALDHAS